MRRHMARESRWNMERVSNHSPSVLLGIFKQTGLHRVPRCFANKVDIWNSGGRNWTIAIFGRGKFDSILNELHLKFAPIKLHVQSPSARLSAWTLSLSVLISGGRRKFIAHPHPQSIRSQAIISHKLKRSMGRVVVPFPACSSACAGCD